MKKRFMSVPIEYTQSTTLEADDIKIPVEILVMHDKKNPNKSNFEIEAIESAKESIKNIPILGYIRKIDGNDSKDFAGHEIELSIKNGELKFIYLERPIGVIPETNNYEYVEVNGKTYVKVIGYIWKEYLNDGYSILQENPKKSVSMEITVDDYTIDKDGIIDIKAYRYLGVTILGDNVIPAMEGANMQVIGQFSEQFSNDFYEKVETLNNELKEKFKGNTTSTEGGDNGEMNIPKGDENMDNTILSFSATYRQKREALSNALDPIIVKDDSGEVTEETYYYVEDFDDDFVYVEKYFWNQTNSDCTYGRYGYSFDETGLIATITGEFEKMILTWLTEQENQDIQTARDTAEGVSIEYEALKIGVEDYKNNVSGLESEKEILSTMVSEFEASIVLKDSEIATLQTYHDTKELEIKQFNIDEIISEFEEVLAENEEFKAIKEKCMTYEIEDLKKELFILEGRLKHIKSTKVTKKVQSFSSKVSVVEPKGNETESYYGNAVKYIPK